jgi:thiol:disulfide interchange protein
MRFRVILLILFVAAVLPCLARVKIDEDRSPEPPSLGFSVKAEPETVQTPGEGRILLRITVPDGYHIFGGKELKISLDTTRLKIKKISCPKTETEEGFKIYRGSVDAGILFEVPDSSSGTIAGNVILNWQGCQDFGDKVCFMPTTSKVPFELKVKADPAAAALKSGAPEGNNEEPHAEKAAQSAGSPAIGSLPDLSGFAEKGRFTGFLSGDDFADWFDNANKGIKKEANLFEKMAKENVLLAVLVAMLFGFLSSLTPCVYPIIPVTIAYIGSKSSGKGRFSGFVLSLFFVMGLAIVYAALGVISSALGASFGSITQKPAVGISVAAIFALLGLSMIGLFQISMPGKFATTIEQGKKKGKGYLGAFLIGALSGLVASPCIGPLLGAILVIVASIGSMVLGFVYLFAFALGMGILFIVIGTFSGVLASLPRSGSWMDVVKVVFGSLIFAAAFYFGAVFIPPKLYFALSGCLIGFVAAFLFFGGSRHFLPPALRIVGTLLTIAAFAAVLPLTPAWNDEDAPSNGFETNLNAAIKRAIDEKKPLLLDFRADWCAYCLKLEKETWPTEKAAGVFKHVIPVKIDFTEESEFRTEMEKRLHISGLPTILLLVPADKNKADGKNSGD